MTMNMIITPAELTVFAELVASFYELNRRYPTEGETATLLSVARTLADPSRKNTDQQTLEAPMTADAIKALRMRFEQARAAEHEASG